MDVPKINSLASTLSNGICNLVYSSNSSYLTLSVYSREPNQNNHSFDVRGLKAPWVSIGSFRDLTPYLLFDVGLSRDGKYLTVGPNFKKIYGIDVGVYTFFDKSSDNPFSDVDSLILKVDDIVAEGMDYPNLTGPVDERAKLLRALFSDMKRVGLDIRKFIESVSFDEEPSDYIPIPVVAKSLQWVIDSNKLEKLVK